MFKNHLILPLGFFCALSIMSKHGFSETASPPICLVKRVNQPTHSLEVRGGFRNPDVIKLEHAGAYRLSPSGHLLAIAQSSRHSLLLSSTCYHLAVLNCKTGEIKGYEAIDCAAAKVNPGGVTVVNLRWRAGDSQLVYDIRAGKAHKDVVLTLEKQPKP